MDLFQSKLDSFGGLQIVLSKDLPYFFSPIAKVKKTSIVLDDREHVVHSYNNRKFVLFFELDITDF